MCCFTALQPSHNKSFLNASLKAIWNHPPLMVLSLCALVTVYCCYCKNQKISSSSGVSQTSCARSPRTPGCQSRASPASASTPRVQTAWSPCSDTSRTPIQGFSSSLSSCQGRHLCMVRAHFCLDLLGQVSLREICCLAYVKNYSEPSVRY